MVLTELLHSSIKSEKEFILEEIAVYANRPMTLIGPGIWDDLPPPTKDDINRQFIPEGNRGPTTVMSGLYLGTGHLNLVVSSQREREFMRLDYSGNICRRVHVGFEEGDPRGAFGSVTIEYKPGTLLAQSQGLQAAVEKFPELALFPHITHYEFHPGFQDDIKQERERAFDLDAFNAARRDGRGVREGEPVEFTEEMVASRLASIALQDVGFALKYGVVKKEPFREDPSITRIVIPQAAEVQEGLERTRMRMYNATNAAMHPHHIPLANGGHP